MIQLYLDQTIKRPALSLDSEMGPINCLVDTGAIMSVWCLPLFLFKKCYPDAEKTSFRTTVSGFGGMSYKKRDIWRIPEFILEDEGGSGQYVIRNMLIALVDDTQVASFNMILSTQVFHGSAFAIFDKADDKRLEIYSEYDRPVVCVPGETVDRSMLDEKAIGMLVRGILEDCMDTLRCP